MEHEGTKGSEVRDARRLRNGRTSAFAYFVLCVFVLRGFVLRAFVVFRDFVFQTLLTIISQIPTRPIDMGAHMGLLNRLELKLPFWKENPYG